MLNAFPYYTFCFLNKSKRFLHLRRIANSQNSHILSRFDLFLFLPCTQHLNIENGATYTKTINRNSQKEFDSFFI